MHRLIAVLLLACALLSAQIADIPPTTPANTAFTIVNDNFTYTAARLVEYGTTLPATCPSPYVFFKTDATAGQNLYYCTAANTWTVQTAGGLTTYQFEGAPVGSPRAQVDFDLGDLLVGSAGDSGTTVQYVINADDAKLLRKSVHQAGTPLYLAPVSASGANYIGTLSPALTAYSTGMVLHFRPDVSCAAGAVTLNVNSVGSVNLKQSDGSTDPGAAGCLAGVLYPIWFDGTVFRLPAAASAGGTAWGAITGTLSAQTDLQGALDAKAASSHTHAASDTTSGIFSIARGGTGVSTLPGSSGQVLYNNGGALGAKSLAASDLPNTAVTPGSYTSTNLTVDAQGRITAASNETSKTSFVIPDPTTSLTNLPQTAFGRAVTIIRVACSTNTGTATIQLDERAEITPNTAGTNVMTSSLVCDNDSQITTSFTNAGIAQYAPLNLQIIATSGTPGVVRVHIFFQ